MKHNSSSSALQRVITNAYDAKGTSKTELFIRYFRQDNDLVRIRDLYQGKYYYEALERLISYIQSRKRILHLTCCILGERFVNTYINDYKGIKNPCAIRSERQLVSLFSTFPSTGKKEEKKTLLRLVQKAKKSKSFLLLIDKGTDTRSLFRELIHELNAWLYSGCAEGRENLRCMMRDWRMNLLNHKGHRDLDAYFLKNQKKAGAGFTKRDLNEKIIEVVYTLSKSGLLQTLVPLRKKDLFKHAHLYTAAAKLPWGMVRRVISSYGVSFDSGELAMIKSLSELLERISFQWDGRVPLKTVSSGALLNEGYFTPYIKGKDGIKNVFGCVEGMDFLSGRTVFIPAQFIYAGYLDKNHEDVISPFTSMGSGVAAGEDHYATLLNALYELIERDALMTAFFNNAVPFVIDEDSFTDPHLKQARSFLEGQGLRHQIFDITNDLEVPTYLSLINKSGKTFFAAGGVKSHRDPKVALYGAVEESYLEWVLKQEKINRLGLKYNSRVNSSHIPVLTYDRYHALHSKALPVKKAPSFPFPAISKQKELGEIIQRLKKKDHSVLYTDISPSWLKGNFQVYRVFVPSLQPLFFTAREKWINKKRIHDVGEFFRKRKKN